MLNLENAEIMLQQETRPEVTLIIMGKEIPFLCDTGASKTVIHPDELPNLQLSEQSILVKSANGRIHSERLSAPVEVLDEETDKNHVTQIVLSRVCPCNLLGRDLLHALNIAVVPHRDGLRAQRLQEIHVYEGTKPVNYWYSLDLVTTGPASVTQNLIEKARKYVKLPSIVMDIEELHCTMYYRHAQGPDTAYEKLFLKEKQTILSLKQLYWNKEGMCAASCQLTAEMKNYIGLMKNPISH